MKGYKFYAEMPTSRGSKAGSRAYPPFTRKTLVEWASCGFHNNCIAVPLPIVWYGEHLEKCDAFGADTERSNAPVMGIQVEDEWLRKRCVLIGAELARQLHPNLFSYLEAPTP